MKVFRYEAHEDGVNLSIEWDKGEGMPDVPRILAAINSGAVLRPTVTPSSTMSLQPYACRRGQQDCDDCPELRCGDQMWPLLREPEYVALVTPGATDAERLDAALRLCWYLRVRADDLETIEAETSQRLAGALRRGVELESRLARALETIEELRRDSTRRGGIPGPEESRETVSPHRLERP